MVIMHQIEGACIRSIAATQLPPRFLSKSTVSHQVHIEMTTDDEFGGPVIRSSGPRPRYDRVGQVSALHESQCRPSQLRFVNIGGE